MRSKDAEARIIYVRHGETDFPRDRIYCDDREDPPLNATGCAQALAVAQQLAGCGAVRLYTSPAARTLATAQALSQVLGEAVPLESLEALRERRFGVWEGLWFNEIEQRYPNQYPAWKRDQTGFMAEGGESMYGLLARVLPVIQGIAERHRNETVIVVSHVGPIRALLCHAAGIPLERHRQIIVDNASPCRVDYGERQNNLVYLNLARREG